MKGSRDISAGNLQDLRSKHRERGEQIMVRKRGLRPSEMDGAILQDCIQDKEDDVTYKDSYYVSHQILKASIPFGIPNSYLASHQVSPDQATLQFYI